MTTLCHRPGLTRTQSTLIAVAGIAIALIFSFILTLVSEENAVVALAVFVGVLSGVYFGVALSPTGVRNTVMNIAMSLLFAAFALLGVWASPMFFALACFLHAAWDVVIAHPRALNEPVAPWYMPICVGADIVVGVFVVWFF